MNEFDDEMNDFGDKEEDDSSLSLYDQVDSIFSAQGSLSRLMSHKFEYRKEQQEMALFIAEQINAGKGGLVEAGTGTGKSLAYLVPLAIWSLHHNSPVIISTETRALQDQILTKDLAIVRKLGLEPRVEVAYGASNYLCLRRYDQFRSQSGLVMEERELLSKLDGWIKTSASGLRHKIPFPVPAHLWQMVCREGDNSLNRKCPFFSKCFYHRARRKWMEANIVVVNHALFFANSAANSNILPESKFIVFDEAHSLEKVISDQYRFIINLDQLEKVISIIYEKGRVQHLSEILSQEAQEKIREKLDLIRNQALELFNRFNVKETEDFAIQTKPMGKDPILDSIESVVSRIKNSRKEYEKQKKNKEDDAETMLPVERFVERLDEWGRLLKEFLLLEFKERKVYWVSPPKSKTSVFSQEPVKKKKGRKGKKSDSDYLEDLGLMGQLSLEAAPFSVDRILYPGISEKSTGIFFVSATLAVNGQFNHFKWKLGIPEEIDGLALPSPFEFKSRVAFYSSKHIADPTENEDKYIQNIAYISERVARITKGNIFILFTSYRHLNMVYEKLQDLEEDGFTLMAQDSRPASVILEEYREMERPILCATAAFWQGVDLPGDELKAVLLTRIPFAVPNDPVEIARNDFMKAKGMNPFMLYSVPEAAIRLKQGFGRLMRRKDDYGIVALLDSRLHTKSYGDILFRSLPESANFQKLDQMELFYQKLAE